MPIFSPRVVKNGPIKRYGWLRRFLYRRWNTICWYWRFGPKKCVQFVDQALAMRLLEGYCSDYDICNRDWPRHGFTYRVRASFLMAYGSGYGRTLYQAAKRAIADAERRDARHRAAGMYADFSDDWPRYTEAELDAVNALYRRAFEARWYVRLWRKITKLTGANHG